jgi:hypothetical protein
MWLKPGGYSAVTNKSEKPLINRGQVVSPFGVQEMDSFTCAHCQRITFVGARTNPEDLGGRCTCCDKLICKGCVGKTCRPIERWLEQMESKYLFAKALASYRDWD